MADRYWVGGAGSWNSTTKWSTSSGGASGASVPTATDNVIFDDNSNVYSVTVTTGATCANLTITPDSVLGVNIFSIQGTFVITGTLSIPDSAGNRRIFWRSDTAGLVRDVSVAAFGTISDMDFRDIRIVGAGGTLSGTRVGNIGNNSGIIFDTPKNVYRKGTGNWNANQWSLQSGGSVDINNFPLPQDTAIFDTNTTSGTITINEIYYLSSINASNSSTITLSMANNLYYHRFCGDLILGTSVTFTQGASSGFYFVGDRNQNINLSTQSITVSTSIAKSGGSFILQNDLTMTNQLWFDRGTLDLNGYNLTSLRFDAGDVTLDTKILYLRSGTYTITGVNGTYNPWVATGTGLTIYPGTSTILLSNNTTTGRTFVGGGYTYNNLTIGGNTSTSTTTITGNNTFGTIASTKTVAHTLALGTTTQRFSGWTMTGTSGNVVTVSGTASMIYTGTGVLTGIDYINMNGYAYAPNANKDVLYIGANSTASGSQGWLYSLAPGNFMYFDNVTGGGFTIS